MISSPMFREVDLYVLILLILPVLGAAVVAMAAASIRQGHTPLSERLERSVLFGMASLPFIGAALLLLARILAAHSQAVFWPIPLPDFVGEQNSANVTATPTSTTSLILPFAEFLLAFYVAGCAVLATRLVRAHLRLDHIVHQSCPVPGVTKLRLTDIGISPFITRDGTIIMSQDLFDELEPASLAMIVTHEAAHFERQDPFWFQFLAWLEVLQWPNIFLRQQIKRCRLVAELAADEAALTRTQTRPKVYARTLVTALRHTAENAPSCVPAVFSPRKIGDASMRIEMIMGARGRDRKPTHLKRGLAIMACSLPLIFAQWSLAGAAMMQEGELSTVPVEGRITSAFGKRPHPKTGKEKMHRGVDIAAPIGTPVFAAGAGTVKKAKRDAKGYGNIVVIDHGDGLMTLYGQLNDFSVETGATLRAGQQFAEVGSSGDSTGPHLHFEVILNGEPVNPATYFPQLTK